MKIFEKFFYEIKSLRKKSMIRMTMPLNFAFNRLTMNLIRGDLHIYKLATHFVRVDRRFYLTEV